MKIHCESLVEEWESVTDAQLPKEVNDFIDRRKEGGNLDVWETRAFIAGWIFAQEQFYGKAIDAIET
jgi:hypothetical protein